MEQLMSDVMHQRELWKDRIFFRAINEDEDEFCAICKEKMRQAFYVNGDEEKALEWRPGNRDGKSDCPCKNCKYYAWRSFEDDSTTEKNEPYPDDESD